MGATILGIFLERPFEPCHRLLGVLARHAAEPMILQTAKQAVVSVKIARPLASRDGGVPCLDPTDDGGDNVRRELVLQVEQVLQR